GLICASFTMERSHFPKRNAMQACAISSSVAMPWPTQSTPHPSLQSPLFTASALAADSNSPSPATSSSPIKWLVSHSQNSASPYFPVLVASLASSATSAPLLSAIYCSLAAASTPLAPNLWASSRNPRERERRSKSRVPPPPKKQNSPPQLVPPQRNSSS